MGTYSESLRNLAADLHSGSVPIDDVEARVCAALEVPTPKGNPDLLRGVARDLHQAARDIDEVSVDLGTLRRDTLPDVWEGREATAATERMRTVEQHAEESRETLHRISGCLVRLAGGLSGAQTRDRAAREYVDTGLACCGRSARSIRVPRWPCSPLASTSWPTHRPCSRRPAAMRSGS